MSRRASSSEVVIYGYLAFVAAMILAFRGRIPWAGAHLAAVAVLGGATLALSRLGERHPARCFWPVLLVPVCFKQIGHLVPGIHPFADRAWDLRLHALDGRLFGDVPGFLRSIAWAPLADAMMLGYLSYYFLPLVLGGALYARGETGKFREAATVLLLSWFVSYLGYFAIPAVGPHLAVDAARTPALEGVVLAGPALRMILRLEGSMPDAFPSGHALVAMVTLALAWRLRRPLFWGLLPFGALLVLATMYLRLHYVVDVLASVLLAPACWAGGRALHRLLDAPPATSSPAPS